MDILKVYSVDGNTMTVNINVCSLLVLLVACFLLVNVFFPYAFKYVKRKQLKIKDINFSFSNVSVSFEIDTTTQRLAYMLWVEIVTRKIGLPYEEDKDVIVEVYNSWYESFKIIRSMLKEVDPRQLENAKVLIDLTMRILNEGMRPHLTTWQAKFRAWYTEEKDKHKDKSPQEIQRMYPEYDALIKDLRKANEDMMKFAELVKKIAFN